MPTPSARQRRTAKARAGLARAAVVAARLGIGLRDARHRAGLSQARLAESAGMSSSMISRLERGRGTSASLDTWSLAAAALGEQIVSFLEAMPGASAPRDVEHLRRQELVIATARSGGWTARPEAPLQAALGRPRSIDVLLERLIRGELGVVEVWDYLDDVGAAMRSLDEKHLLMADRSADSRVGALWVVRGTHRNRQLVAAYPELFSARFPASSRAWISALTDAGTPMPDQPGLVWTDVGGTRLIAWHRPRDRSVPRPRG